MATIFDLSPYQLFRLQSLDPILDDNYQDILGVIFPILDEKSQELLLVRNLNPRGITSDLSRRTFSHVTPDSIESLIRRGLSNTSIVAIAKKMQVFLAELPKETSKTDETTRGGGSSSIDAYDLAGKIEGLLLVLDKLAKNMSEEEERELVAVRVAFLYELAQIINLVHVHIAENRRGINAEVVKTFIKQVFIKHELQGINFRAWDSDDFDALQLGHFPEILKEEISSRRLSIIETERFWFLVAPIRTFDINRYSITRFLNEDTEYGLYITYGCFVPRHRLNEQVLQIILKLISTIYTLEMSVSATLLSFMGESTKAFSTQLQPLLRQTLSFGEGLENAIAKRLEQYKNTLNLLILSKIPHVMHSITSNPDDRAIFVHYVGVLFNNIWQDIEMFSLLPAVEYADATEILSARILCYRLFMKKSQNFYWDSAMTWEEKAQGALLPAQKIEGFFQEVDDERASVEKMYTDLEVYEENLAKGKFLTKLGFGKPDYDREDLEAYTKEVSSNFFIKIVRMTKEQKQFVVYYEFEGLNMFKGDKEYRHYSIPTGKTGLDKLPLLARLPENRQNIDIKSFELV